MEFIDYYKILGVNEDADYETIKRSFRKLAKLYHPDSCVNESKEEQEKKADALNKVYEAYEVLKDDIKRLEYDNLYQEYKMQQKYREKQKKVKTTKDYLVKVKNDIKKSYKELRKEEKKFPFLKRHAIYDSRVNKEYSNKKEQIIFYLKRGSLHVFGEAFYQIRKLSYFSEDTIPKFVLRNRVILGTIVMGSVIISGINKEPEEIIIPDGISSSFVSDDGKVKLTRSYRVKDGDTYTSLAEDSNSEVYEIKDANGRYTDNLYVGEKIFLPYEISIDDLSYYIQQVKYNKNMPLEEFARLYDTNVLDLVSLNTNGIVESNDCYFVISDSLNVPKFITQEELQYKKEFKNK